ncbi:uncharacterized protein SCDLUD_002940 [Saccharomycodes ludwigii]|uniref:uncharacterized protein n=1 Tax=Saccharomycodes ludwigii TaxID=36035 RepID=UPI001E82C83A|nr:hypothetical protein SCDLUD_002940 [Saccharomycodes ludwigii]KAH3901446.1 hypothetical protein SCDLUD_002940 [Saccharomycodes ludwigii]
MTPAAKSNNNKKCSILILNGLLLSTSTYGLYRCTLVHLPDTLRAAGHKQFLTNISLFFTILYNISRIGGVLTNRSGSLDGCISTEVLLPIVLVVETIVTLVYWPLRLFFIGLIYQSRTVSDGTPVIKVALPIYVDMFLHLFPLIGLLIDYFKFKKVRFNKFSDLGALLSCLVLATSYKLWLNYLITDLTTQKFPYPFLDVREPIKSIIMYTLSLVGFGFYKLYKSLHPGVATGAGKNKDN